MTKKVIAVLLPLPINQSFLYTVDNDNYIVAGDYVVVPFGHKRLIGIVWQLNIQTTRKLKYIEQKIDLPNITAKLKAFAEWVADYNLIPVGILVKMIMGGVIKISNIDKLVYTNQKQQIKKVNYQLNSEQLVAKNKITTNLNSYSVTLLDGETGSGKTEVYLSVILELIKAESNAQILILLPEIVLTSQLVQRIRMQISDSIVEWHSHLTAKVRKNNWLNITYGNAQIIIGARSALFLPYKNLKLCIAFSFYQF